MRQKVLLGGFAAIALTSLSAPAGSPNVKGKIAGQDKLLPDVYAEAGKLDSHRWNWREPSPSVPQQYRPLSANPSRDICIVATGAAGQPAQEAVTLRVTGGRVYPTTLVVSPGTSIAFKNLDPFKHRLYAVSQATLKADDLQPNAARTWSPPGVGKFEVRDELFPSVRTFIVVDPTAISSVFPGKDGSFAFSLPPGDYFLKAFFQGKTVGKPMQIVAKDKSTLDIALNVGEGADAK